MLTFKDKVFYLNDKPILLMAGEIHYFRLDPEEWQDRINLLKSAGFNMVATYIPWVIHELNEGDIDLDGHNHPRHNLKAFIALCEANGLYLFLRPGPFVMAEMKNDGIPFWVYEKYPEAVPQSFDGAAPTTPTLDYLSPGFLKSAEKWYEAVMGLISGYTPDKGGKVLAVQLDNEIGMLSWVSNRPDLTPLVLEQFAGWLIQRHGPEACSSRYPFNLGDPEVRKERFQSPRPPYDGSFFKDFGYFMRDRYRRYVMALKDMAEEAGLRDVLYVVNIHGTGGGRGFTYPIGVSQLMETYAEQDDIISGSDVYFSDFKIHNFQDMYLCNGITDATNRHGKPLTCVEFNLGDSNFGNDLNCRAMASSNDFKIRLYLAQGNKLLNDYLFCGGTNYRLPMNQGDGYDRIATTGEEHGFAAPIGPTGIQSYSFPRMARVIGQIMAFEEKHATAFIPYDPICFGFIPDDYMTEYVYNKSELCEKIAAGRASTRSSSWESAVRAFLLMGVKLGALDIQNHDLPETIRILIVSSSEYMDEKLQSKLLNYVRQGGRLLMQGQIPRYDGTGEPCTILLDALGISDLEKIEHRPGYIPAFIHEDFLSGLPELFEYPYETFAANNSTALMRTYDGGKVGAMHRPVGRGQLVLITARVKCNLEFYRRILKHFETAPELGHDLDVPGYGIFMTETVNPHGERFIHLLNMDDIDKDFNLFRHGKRLFDRKVHLPANDGLMLPFEVRLHGIVLHYATIELFDQGPDAISFRNTEKFSQISLTTSWILQPEPFMTFRKDGNTYYITTDNRLLEDVVTLRFSSPINNMPEEMPE